jgi:hypothetical protein
MYGDSREFDSFTGQSSQANQPPVQYEWFDKLVSGFFWRLCSLITQFLVEWSLSACEALFGSALYTPILYGRRLLPNQRFSSVRLLFGLIL